MAFIPRDHDFWTQGSDKPGTVSPPAGASVTVFSNGATLYYKSTSDVTSSSNDGSIATGSSAVFTAPKYVITAQGASTSVFTRQYDSITDQVALNVTGGKPYNVRTWQPATATSGTDTACTNGTAYVGSIYVPTGCTVTGVEFLIGSVGGTDKVIASLHDSSGAVLANSATAGATVGTAANTQQVAFTSTYPAQGPAYYFLGLTFNGTTAKFRSVPAFTHGGLVGNGVTQTFGTVAAFTAPTTFTADKIPVAWLY